MLLYWMAYFFGTWELSDLRKDREKKMLVRLNGFAPSGSRIAGGNSSFLDMNPVFWKMIDDNGRCSGGDISGGRHYYLNIAPPDRRCP